MRIPALWRPAAASAKQSVGDPAATRTIYLIVAVLVVLAVGLLYFAYSYWRRTRPGYDDLTPDEPRRPQQRRPDASRRERPQPQQQRRPDDRRPSERIPQQRQQAPAPRRAPSSSRLQPDWWDDAPQDEPPRPSWAPPRRPTPPPRDPLL